MISSIYNYVYVDDYNLAKQQLEFYERKLAATKRQDINDENKQIRVKRIELVLECIKYTYSL